MIASASAEGHVGWCLYFDRDLSHSTKSKMSARFRNVSSHPIFVSLKADAVHVSVEHIETGLAGKAGINAGILPSLDLSRNKKVDQSEKVKLVADVLVSLAPNR